MAKWLNTTVLCGLFSWAVLLVEPITCWLNEPISGSTIEAVYASNDDHYTSWKSYTHYKNFEELFASPLVMIRGNGGDSNFGSYRMLRWASSAIKNDGQESIWYENMDVQIVPESFSVTHSANKFSDGMIIPNKRYKIVWVDFGYKSSPPIIVCSEDPNSKHGDVAYNPIKTIMELKVAVVTYSYDNHDFTDAELELVKKAVLTKKPLRIRGTLFLRPYGDTLAEVFAYWKENDLRFHVDSVEAISEEQREEEKRVKTAAGD